LHVGFRLGSPGGVSVRIGQTSGIRYVANSESVLRSPRCAALEEAAVDERCEGGPASGGGWESVHRTTLAPLAAQNRRHVGPTILFDRPRQDPPLLASIVSFWARGRLYNRVVNIRLL
jgi:hypothetical protein